MVIKNIYPLTGVFIFIFGLSPLSYTIGLNFSILSIIVMILVASRINIISKNKYKLLLIPLSLILSFVSFIYWGGDSIKILLLPYFYLLSFLYVLGSRHEDIRIFTEVSTKILIIFIIGAWIGFIYRLTGGQSLFSLPLKGGEYSLDLFLTTFSKLGGISDIAGVIRPTAIYDEPGSFAFIICSVALLRHKLKLKKWDTWILLLGGLITFSLALFIYIFFHIGSYIKWNRKIIRNFLFTIILILGTVSILPNLGYFDTLILARLEINESTGHLAGDNRSEAVELAASYINPEMLLWGIDKLCMLDVSAASVKYGRYGDNPLYPLVSFGLLISWIYYFIIILLIVIGIRRKSNFVYLGLAMLFFQRPYFSNFIYSFFIFYSIKVNFMDRYVNKSEKNENEYLISKE